MFAPDDVITVAQLCERLHVNKTWVYEKKRKRELTAIRMGKYLRFSWAEVSAWLESKRKVA